MFYCCLFSFRDTTISSLSNEFSTTSPIQEIATDGVEHSTSKPYVEESDVTVTHELTTTTEEKSTPSPALSESTTDMKVTFGKPIINPAISLMSNLFQVMTTESASTSIVTAPTTLMTPVVTLPAMLDTMMSDENTNQIFKQPDETVSVVTTTPAPTSTLPAVTMGMGFVLSENDIFKQPDNAVTVAVTEDTKTDAPAVTDTKIEPTTSQLSTLSPFAALFNPTAENSVIQSHDEIDNVLTMSSNEETTRMASSTDSKVDTGDKQVLLLQAETEPPKSQETKNELDTNGKSGSNSIFASFFVLSMTVLYVIV